MGCSFPPSGDLPDPGIKPASPVLAGGYFTTMPLGKPSSYPFVVQSLSCVCLFASPWTAARKASLSFTISWSLLTLMSIESVTPSSHLILRHCLLLLPSIFPSIRVFSSGLALPTRWPKYWSFSISPSNDYSGLTSFKVDWFDLLALQKTLKSLFLHQSLKASIIWGSAFFMAQL